MRALLRISCHRHRRKEYLPQRQLPQRLLPQIRSRHVDHVLVSQAPTDAIAAAQGPTAAQVCALQ